MPHGPAGMLKSRVAAPANAGRPKGPAGLRVSAMRQGVTATKRRGRNPACVTMNVWPAMVTVPERGVPTGLAANE
jgi:hypothetical protein